MKYFADLIFGLFMGWFIPLFFHCFSPLVLLLFCPCDPELGSPKGFSRQGSSSNSCFPRAPRCGGKSEPLLCLSSAQAFNSDRNPEFQMDLGFLSLTPKQEYSALSTLCLAGPTDSKGRRSRSREQVQCLDGDNLPGWVPLFVPTGFGEVKSEL